MNKDGNSTKSFRSITSYAFLFIIVLVISVGFYYINGYESPEDCFVKEMRKWAEKENATEQVPTLIGDDSKMAVARAKAIRNDYAIDEMSDENRPVYLQVGTIFEYCNVK